MNAKRLPIMLLVLAGWAHAQGLPDPTRPPVLVEGEATATPAPSGLQSIIHRKGGKSAAVINGRYVELGGKVGDATLTRINEDSVELRSASGRETMYLTPGIGKKKVKP
jgi:MSHA biogenesis protein MshK